MPNSDDSSHDQKPTKTQGRTLHEGHAIFKRMRAYLRRRPVLLNVLVLSWAGLCGIVTAWTAEGGIILFLIFGLLVGGILLFVYDRTHPEIKGETMSIRPWITLAFIVLFTGICLTIQNRTINGLHSDIDSTNSFYTTEISNTTKYWNAQIVQFSNSITVINNYWRSRLTELETNYADATNYWVYVANPANRGNILAVWGHSLFLEGDYANAIRCWDMCKDAEEESKQTPNVFLSWETLYITSIYMTNQTPSGQELFKLTIRNAEVRRVHHQWGLGYMQSELDEIKGLVPTNTADFVKETLKEVEHYRLEAVRNGEQ